MSKRGMSKVQEILSKLIKNKYKVAVIVLFIIGIIVRVSYIDVLPKGFNQDEASSGYEAFSLMKNGVDRNNKSFPVQFIAWGSGQNVLYSYFIIPFMAILGVNLLAVRLPMAIVGCISLFVFYQLLKRNINKKVALVGLFMLVISPWHIMKSRWGLESNLFPDLILWAVFLILEAIREKPKLGYLYVAFAILGLSAYAYRNIIFLLTYVCNTFINSIYKKKIYNNKTSNNIIRNNICDRFSINIISNYKYI